jgi:hypothetical protein
VATSDAIADVSRTLVDLLTAALTPLGTSVQLHDLQATPAIGNLLTVFLFMLREDAHAKNRPPSVTLNPGPPPRSVLQRPPVALTVHYLLNPWSDDHPTNQKILGRAMLALHDSAIVGGSQLRGSLAANNEELHFSMVPLTLEDQLRVWHALTKPFRLGVTYEARVVRIDSQVSVTQPAVRERGLVPAEAEPA